MTNAVSIAQLGANNSSFTNRIINGAFGIWQRGTSGAMTTSPTYVAADRWGVDQASSAAATFSQSTSVPTAVAQYSGKVQRNNASTGTNNIVIAQAFETANSYDLAGQSATLSFYAKAGANFSASSNTLNFNVFYGQGTDQSLALMRSNSWTNQTNSGSSVSLTTTWTKYTFTVSVPAGTTQVGLQFYFTPVGTAGADDAFYITSVQLEKGSTATSFDYRPYGTELQLAQRYCFALVSTGENLSTFVGFWRFATGKLVVPISFPVTMRTSPTTTIPSGNNSWSVEDGFNPYTGTPTIERPTPYNVMLNIPLSSNPSFSTSPALAVHMFSASGTVCLLASAEL